MFKQSEQKFLKEIVSVYLASIVGLLGNLLLMWIAVDLLSANEMLSKVIATGIVFLYNFLVRKFWIYKQ